MIVLIHLLFNPFCAFTLIFLVCHAYNSGLRNQRQVGANQEVGCLLKVLFLIDLSSVKGHGGYWTGTNGHHNQQYLFLLWNNGEKKIKDWVLHDELKLYQWTFGVRSATTLQQSMVHMNPQRRYVVVGPCIGNKAIKING